MTDGREQGRGSQTGSGEAGGEEIQDEAAREFHRLRRSVEAFDGDLRAQSAELTVMRRAIEGLFGQLETYRPPDHNAALGALAEKLVAVDRRLAGFAGHPALKLTPAEHGQAVALAGAGAVHTAVRTLDTQASEMKNERHQLARLIGTIRDQEQQRRALIWTGAACLAAGLVLYPLVSAFVPGGSWLVALAAGDIDRWQAGSDLMQQANPQGTRDLAVASQLYASNYEAIRDCFDAAAEAGQEQRCTITVPAR